jgi:hypothetical protein
MFIKNVIRPNRVHDLGWGAVVDQICRCFNIFLKVVILIFLKKLSYVFTGHLGYHWIHKINQFKLDQIPHNLIGNLI